MKLHFLGGAMEIGGSCIYIRIGGKGILFDCGIRQSVSKDPIPDFRTIQEQGGLDAIVVSHAHMDHIGTLPMISKAYPDVRIYMTAMTAELTRVLLYDSLKIMKYREDEIPHYSEQDVLSMLGRIHPVGYQTPFPVFDKFTLTFYPAGHIAGAACVYLVTEEGSLFYSGDFSSFSQRTIEGIRIPKLRPDVSIVETTYGNRLHANRMSEEKRLVEVVRECIKENKKILIPVFALGRAQEVLLILRAAIQNQEIPAVPVYVDGMVRDINIMYTRNPIYLKNALAKRVLKGNEPFYTKEIRPVEPMEKREELLKESGPAIFLSSSGMLTGGPSAQYAASLASSEEACIIITGYQDEESPGRQLLNLLEKPEDAHLSVNGKSVPVRCRIEQVGLSAHGDKSEITALLERLSSRRVFLVHGNREAIDELGNELAAEDYRRQIYLPECGQEYEILLHKKRKQILFKPDYTMQMNQPFTREDEKRLWDYWQEHYPGKIFSVSQIAHIWYGRAVTDEEIFRNMQDIFLNSPYFMPNARRLFLFEASTPEEVMEALAKRELTIQELEERIQDAFSEYQYRKISYYPDRKEAVLQFDYPDSVNPEEFQKIADAFLKENEWTVQLSPSMNHNAAALLLSVLFEDHILKTSYYQDKKCYSVTLSGKTEQALIAGAAEKFKAVTGWTLVTDGKAPKGDVQENFMPCGTEEEAGFFLPSDPSVKRTEQNMAFLSIERAFEALPHRPDKKSLRQDGRGQYLEVGFISPAIGRQYGDTLQSLANKTGWRIRISDKINQNGLFKTAQVLCMKYGIELVKNPSYLPEKRLIQMKVKQTEEREKLNSVEKAFLEQTGCGCTFVI